MTTTFALLLLTSAIIAGLLIGIALHYFYWQTNIEKVPPSFKGAAAAFNLSPTAQQVLGNRTIGIDCKKNKLLFLETRGSKHNGYLINLEDLKNCAVERQYETTHADGIKGSNLESHLTRILMKLYYKNGSKPTLLTFYDELTNSKSEIRERADEANKWHFFISAALSKPHKKFQKYKNNSKKTEALTDIVFR